MYVRRHMTAPATTVEREVSLETAGKILEAGGFRHLPVVDGEGRLVGMVSDRDLRSSRPSDLARTDQNRGDQARFSKSSVGEIMAADPHFLTLTSTLDDALRSFTSRKFGALPVVDGKGRVAGIFSVHDLLAAYRKLFGLGEAGSVLVEIEDDGRPGLTSDIAGVLEERNIEPTRIIRVAGVEGVRPPVVYLRVNTYNRHSLREAFDARSLTVLIDRPEENDAGR